jgi:hypothetical protein
MLVVAIPNCSKWLKVVTKVSIHKQYWCQRQPVKKKCKPNHSWVFQVRFLDFFPPKNHALKVHHIVPLLSLYYIVCFIFHLFFSLCSSWFPWSTPLVWLVMMLGSWVVQHQWVMLDVIPNTKPRKTRVHSLNQLSKCGNLRISAWWKVEATWGPLLPRWNKEAVSSKETLCGSCFRLCLFLLQYGVIDWNHIFIHLPVLDGWTVERTNPLSSFSAHHVISGCL